MKLAFQDELTTLYHGDCRDYFHSTDKKFDLCLTDPPWGLGEKWAHKLCEKKGKVRLRTGECPDWDREPIDFLPRVISSAKNSIIWGGNFYAVPPSNCWFVWDKLQTGFGADCELAWTDLGLPSKVFRMSRIDAHTRWNRFPKVHLCEKPIELGKWCLDFCKGCKSVIDPFSGSGSFLLAARQKKIVSVGIELDEVMIGHIISRITKRRNADIVGVTSEGFQLD